MDEIEDEIDRASKDRQYLEYKTKLDKTRFIVEMKTGLGSTIKENPLQVTFIKKPWHVRFFGGFRRIMIKIFTRF